MSTSKKREPTAEEALSTLNELRHYSLHVGQRRHAKALAIMAMMNRAKALAIMAAVIKENKRLKAKVKRLNTWHDTLSQAWRDKALKAEAEVKRLTKQKKAKEEGL